MATLPRLLLIATALACVAASPFPASAALSNARQVEILDFYATWCSPCQKMKPMIEGLARQGYPIRLVDIDREKALADRYQVTSVPCLVAVSNGAAVAKLSGLQTEASARQWVSRYAQPTTNAPSTTYPVPRPSRPVTPPTAPSTHSATPPTNPVSIEGATTVETLLRVTYAVPADKVAEVAAFLRTHPDAEFQYANLTGQLRVTAPSETQLAVAPVIRRILAGRRPSPGRSISGAVAVTVLPR